MKNMENKVVNKLQHNENLAKKMDEKMLQAYLVPSE